MAAALRFTRPGEYLCPLIRSEAEQYPSDVAMHGVLFFAYGLTCVRVARYALNADEGEVWGWLRDAGNFRIIISTTALRRAVQAAAACLLEGEHGQEIVRRLGERTLTLVAIGSAERAGSLAQSSGSGMSLDSQWRGGADSDTLFRGERIARTSLRPPRILVARRVQTRRRSR